MTGPNDQVDWRRDLGGAVSVALVQAGTFRSDAGALFGPVPRILWNKWATAELDAENRLLQALNCLLIETPAGRVLVETGIGVRLNDHDRAMRGYDGPWIVPALRDAEEWRVHFHVPLFAERFDADGALRSTQPELLELLACPELAAVPHLEIETYSFEMLPADRRAALGVPTLLDGLQREMVFVLDALGQGAG